MTRRIALAAGFLLALAPLVPSLPVARAQERVTGANYPLAQKFDREFVSRNVQEANVSPQWIGKTDVFWYAARTASGTRYWKVDAEKKTKTPLFDHAVLAAALSEASKKPLDGDTLRLDNAFVGTDGKTLAFAFSGSRYEFDLNAGKLKTIGKAGGGGGGPGGPPLTADAIERLRGQLGDERVEEMLRRLRETETETKKDDTQKKDDMMKKDDTMGGMGEVQPPVGGPNTSYKNYAPDKKKYVFLLRYNLYLCDEGQPEDKATQLSTDGADEYTFATGFGGGGFGGGGKGGGTGGKTAPTVPGDRKTRPNVTWSSDSKAFYVTRSDARNVKDLFLVDSIATPRPKLEQYKYPMPGEADIRKTELFSCDVEKKALTRVPPKWKDERYSDVRWGKNTGELRFVRRDRLRRNLEICALDVFSGNCKCLMSEGFDAAYLEMQQPRYIEETDDFLWWSEKSGWGHFYRYGRDGTLKNAVTSGAWRASRIVELDAKNNVMYFIGNARESGENPYYTHLYRVKLDGTGLTCLDPGAGELYEVDYKLVFGTDRGKQPGGFNQTSTLSPSKKFVVTNSTAVDHAPFATLRDDSGRVLMTLETTDLTALKKTGWRMPETFTVKAADGVTDLYGNMWKPFDFDPKKKYPIIAHVYPGPQTEGVVYRFGAHSQPMQMAQLGFIVVQVGHRGGSPERSKAYHSFGYFNLRDYGLADKKAALEALAARHSFIDIERVGIYGHSGGGFMSAAAVLQTPYNEFFKAAVASAGNHDNNIYNDNWSETYHGLKEVPLDGTNTTTTGTTGTTGKGAGGGFGGKGTGGKGGQKKGPSEEELLEYELENILAAFDPQDEQSVAELERKLAELKARLATLQQDAKKAEGSAAQAPPPRPKGAPLPLITLPPTKFDIHIPTNAELAANLKGHLMLVHGEIDNNVHPANTMRLTDALIKANKRFDLLMIPGARHAFGPAQPYFTQRMWDFFAEHLLNDRQTGADINIKDVKRK